MALHRFDQLRSAALALALRSDSARPAAIALVALWLSIQSLMRASQAS